MALLGTDAGIRAGRVDQRNNRYPELFREAHEPQRLAIAFRMAATEIAHHIFFRVAPFLMRDDNAALRTEQGEPARHRFVVGEVTIAVQLDPTGETSFDVIERKRPLHVPRDLHPLPRAQVAVNLTPSLADFRLDGFDF